MPFNTKQTIDDVRKAAYWPGKIRLTIEYQLKASMTSAYLHDIRFKINYGTESKHQRRNHEWFSKRQQSQESKRYGKGLNIKVPFYKKTKNVETKNV